MLKKITWFIQRGIRGYADCDVWDVDAYLNSIIPPMVRELKDTGYPHSFNQTEWNKTLEDIALGFEAAERLRHDVLPIDAPEHGIMKHGLALFVTHYLDLWD